MKYDVRGAVAAPPWSFFDRCAVWETSRALVYSKWSNIKWSILFHNSLIHFYVRTSYENTLERLHISNSLLLLLGGSNLRKAVTWVNSSMHLLIFTRFLSSSFFYYLKKNGFFVGRFHLRLWSYWYGVWFCYLHEFVCTHLISLGFLRWISVFNQYWGILQMTEKKNLFYF